MLTLGLESSCDETSCAVVSAEGKILSNVVATQLEHSAYGGVIPELASRAHLQQFPDIVKRSLREAGIALEEVELIAVTHTPGLIGSLSVGVNLAKGIAAGLGIPLIGVNHVEAHIHAASLDREVDFPALGIAASGAHTAVFLLRSPLSFELIGKTRDDAIGETFDKVARFLGLPYPGGALIEQLAEQGDPYAFSFSSSNLTDHAFSFSGLKTAVLYAIKGKNSNHKTPLPQIPHQKRADLAASFQRAAFTTIVQKIPSIIKEFSCQTVLVGGGVANNRCFQDMLRHGSSVPVHFASPHLCCDNAAMIAVLGRKLFDLSGPSTEIVPCARYQWPLASFVH